MEPITNSSMLSSTTGLFGATLVDFTEFILFLTDYVKDHPEKIPFKLDDIAQRMHCSLDQIRDLFVPLSKTFELFRIMQKTPSGLPTRLNSSVESNLSSPPIQASKNVSPKQPISAALPVTTTPVKKTIRVNHIQMGQLADFYYLSQKTPLTPKMLPKKFQDLLKIYNDLFIQKTDGWIMSEAGQYFAEQYLACKRINTLPKEIESVNMLLTICD